MTVDMMIRNATYEDLESILTLVKELAAYEHAPAEVWVNLVDYQEAFKEGIFESLVGEIEGQIIGVCIYYLTWSTWKGRMLYLEDFFIKEDFRRHGLGQQLFDAFISRARELNCTLIKWEVLDWNIPALNFYEKNHAEIEKEWWNGKLILKPRNSE
jgi:GNAT superfamily N-acetyltransferase